VLFPMPVLPPVIMTIFPVRSVLRLQDAPWNRCRMKIKRVNVRRRMRIRVIGSIVVGIGEIRNNL